MQLNNLLGDIICIFFPVMFYVWLICFVCLHCHRGATSKPVFSVLHNQRNTNEAEAKRLFVQRFYFSLPPSLSLPSEQRVSVATSHPRPLHPDWQMQCQTFWSRTHLPLLLHSPGQPSVNTSCTRQTAEQVRTRKSREGEEEEEGRETRAKGAFKSGQGQRRDKNDIRQYWVNIQYNTPLTGLGGCGGGCEELLSFHMSFRSEMCWTEEGKPAELCAVKRPAGVKSSRQRLLEIKEIIKER